MEQKKKVLHVIGGGEFGGAEQHILQLLSLLPEQGFIGKVVCFYDAKFAASLRETGIDVEVLQFGRFDFRLLSGLKRLIRKENPDIIHTHGVKANFFGRLASRSFPGIPVVTTIHSLLQYDYSNRLAFLLASKLEQWTRPFNHHYIAISNSIEQSLIEEGVGKEKITKVHHGIDFLKYSKGTDVLRHQLNIRDRGFVIGVVSRLVKIKGIEYVIRAMVEIVQSTSAYLVIVGTGPEEEKLKKLTHDLNLDDNVYFVGFREDINDCLHSFDLFVSASLSEGLGLNVMEAMAASLPIVVTGVGGILDFTEDGVNGLVIPVHSVEAISEKVLLLKEDPVLAGTISAKARETIQRKFTLEAMAKNTAEVYQKLLRG